MFFVIFLVCLSLSARVTPSALPSINTTNLQPFAVTSLSTHTPNGMAGSSPYAQFLVSITNPNTIRLPTTRWGDRNFSSSTANCSTQWIAFTEENPFDRVIPCEAGEISGIWTIVIQRANATGYGPSVTRDFTLQFKLEHSIVLNDGIIRLNFEGRLGFNVNDNLRLICAASGFCNTWLEEAKSPQLVVPVAGVECLWGVCDYHF